jgi:hypothetical protein
MPPNKQQQVFFLTNFVLLLLNDFEFYLITVDFKSLFKIWILVFSNSNMSPKLLICNIALTQQKPSKVNKAKKLVLCGVTTQSSARVFAKLFYNHHKIPFPDWGGLNVKCVCY